MKRGLILLLLLPAALAGCGERLSSNPHVDLQTEHGPIRIELFAEQAPRTVANFLRYVDEGRYATGSFYRVRKERLQSSMGGAAGILQGGLYLGDSTRMLPSIPLETTEQTGLRHNTGTVSMARFEDELASQSEFFIVLGEQPHLDFQDSTDVGMGFAAFGQVVDGGEVVRKLQSSRVRGERLVEPVPFRAVRVQPD